MKCEIDLKDLIELYTQCQNLFENLEPTRLQRILKKYDSSDILKHRRNMLSQQLSDLIDASTLKKNNLRVGASPFVADADEILAEIDGD